MSDIAARLDKLESDLRELRDICLAASIFLCCQPFEQANYRAELVEVMDRFAGIDEEDDES